MKKKTYLKQGYIKIIKLIFPINSKKVEYSEMFFNIPFYECRIMMSFVVILIIPNLLYKCLLRTLKYKQKFMSETLTLDYKNLIPIMEKV